MRCPACGGHHQWAISYAWLGPVILENLLLPESSPGSPNAKPANAGEVGMDRNGDPTTA